MAREFDAAAKIQRGVEWLDRHVPGWHQRVTLRRFNIEDDCRCVLGQIFATKDSKSGYYNAVRYHPGDEGVISAAHASACGFDVGREDVDFERWKALQREWRRVIAERQAAENGHRTRREYEIAGHQGALQRSQHGCRAPRTPLPQVRSD